MAMDAGDGAVPAVGRRITKWISPPVAFGTRVPIFIMCLVRGDGAISGGSEERHTRSLCLNIEYTFFLAALTAIADQTLARSDLQKFLRRALGVRKVWVVWVIYLFSVPLILS